MTTKMSTADIQQDTAVGGFAAAGYAPVDFEHFHLVELPQRLRSGLNERVFWDVKGKPPITIQLAETGSAYSYVAESGQVKIAAGRVDDAEVVLEIPYQAWQDYVYEMRTRFGLLYSGAVRFIRGDFDKWDVWEPAIRCMYSGREIYNPANLELVDLDGSRLDLSRTFELGGSAELMSHFLRTTGFLVIKNALTGQLGRISDEVDRLTEQAREGELWSQWVSDHRGKRFPYRLLYAGLRSQLIASLDDDPIIRQLVSLTGHDLAPVPDRVEGHIAVLKPFGKDTEVTGGNANLPWHKDCGFGGCPITCPAINIGIQLDAANADSSQLWMMAGTAGKVCHDRPTSEELADLPVVALETEPGDVTVHITCGLHAGPPPTGPNPRRTLYVPFYSPRVKDLLTQPLQGYQQVIPNWGNGVALNEKEIQEMYS